MTNKLDFIRFRNPNTDFLTADGLDDAVIGRVGNRLVYSKDKCVEALVKRDKMKPDEADEFLQFNTYDAYVGPLTPIFK